MKNLLKEYLKTNICTDETQDEINGFSGGDESIIAQPIEYEYIFIKV